MVEIKQVDSEEELEAELTRHANILILFTKEGCEHCEHLKETLKKDELKGNVEVVEVPFDHAKTYSLFKELSIDRAPTGLMIKECDFAGQVIGDNEKTVEKIKKTYEDARDACRLKDGRYVPIGKIDDYIDEL